MGCVVEKARDAPKTWTREGRTNGPVEERDISVISAKVTLRHSSNERRKRRKTLLVKLNGFPPPEKVVPWSCRIIHLRPPKGNSRPFIDTLFFPSNCTHTLGFQHPYCTLLRNSSTHSLPPPRAIDEASASPWAPERRRQPGGSARARPAMASAMFASRAKTFIGMVVPNALVRGDRFGRLTNLQRREKGQNS